MPVKKSQKLKPNYPLNEILLYFSDWNLDNGGELTMQLWDDRIWDVRVRTIMAALSEEAIIRGKLKK